jgi:hypothetical protein
MASEYLYICQRQIHQNVEGCNKHAVTGLQERERADPRVVQLGWILCVRSTIYTINVSVVPACPNETLVLHLALLYKLPPLTAGRQCCTWAVRCVADYDPLQHIRRSVVVLQQAVSQRSQTEPGYRIRSDLAQGTSPLQHLLVMPIFREHDPVLSPH